MNYPWIKLYKEFLYDLKVKQLNPIQQLMFVYLMLLADEDGVVKHASVYELLKLMGIESYGPSELMWIAGEKAFEEFVRLDIIDLKEDVLVIKHYQERQKQPLSNAQRQAKYRARIALKQGNKSNESNVTRNTKKQGIFEHASVTDSVTNFVPKVTGSNEEVTTVVTHSNDASILFSSPVIGIGIKGGVGGNEKKFSKREYVTDDVMAEIADKYQVPISFVRSKLDDVCNWEDEKPGRMRGRNWKMTLVNWVKRDAIARREVKNNVKGTGYIVGEIHVAKS